MAENNSKDLISNEVLQKATQDILQTVSEHLYEYTPYTNEEIAEIFDLDNVTAKSLSKVINDEYIAKNKVFSNEHTMELLSKTLAEANQYTTEQIANSGKLERKIVTSTSEVVDENILYLILTDSTNNIYTQYMLIDGNATPLGTTQINLNDYLKTIDFNTKIDEYAKKNTVVLQNDVVGDLTTLSSNQVLSTQGVSDELDKKVDKSSIVTSIDSSSTDSELPSAKTTYNLFKSLNTKIYGEAVNIDILTYAENLTSKGFFPIQVDSITNINVPHFAFSYTNGFIMRTGATKDNTRITVVLFPRKDTEPMGNYIAINTKYNSDAWTGWRYYGSTKVADVSETYITTYLDETYVKPTNTNTNSYSVTNGICEVRIEANCLATTNKLTKIVSGLPKAKNIKYANAVNRNQTLNTNASALFMIAGSDLYITCNYGDTSVSGSRGFYVSFTYPVAEQ